VHGLEVKWNQEIDFVYLDIDDSRTSEFKRALGYRYQPHIFLLDGNGTVLEQWVGYVEGEVLEEAFRRVAQ
jgi:thioredoxin-related protein